MKSNRLAFVAIPKLAPIVRDSLEAATHSVFWLNILWWTKAHSTGFGMIMDSNL